MDLNKLSKLFDTPMGIEGKEILNQEDIVITGYRHLLTEPTLALSISLFIENGKYVVFMDGFKDWNINPFSMEWDRKPIPPRKSYGIYEEFNDLKKAEELYENIWKTLSKYPRYNLTNELSDIEKAYTCYRSGVNPSKYDDLAEDVIFDNGDFRTKLLLSCRLSEKVTVVVNSRLVLKFKSERSAHNFFGGIHTRVKTRNLGLDFPDPTKFSVRTSPKPEQIKGYKSSLSVMETLNKMLELPLKIIERCEYDIGLSGEATRISIKTREGKEINWRQVNRYDYYWKIDSEDSNSETYKNYEEWQQGLAEDLKSIGIQLN